MLGFLTNIKVKAPLPTDWKYRVEKRTELISITSLPNNYPYKGQLAVVVDDTINDGLYLLTKEPNRNVANSGLVLDDWIKLEIKSYVGVSTDTKPTLETWHAGVMFYETDTAVLSMWNGTAWVVLISGAASDNFTEYDKFVDLPTSGASNIIYVVLHNELGADLNSMYRWDATHDNGNGTFGRYELMGGSSGEGETVNPITSELPEPVGGIAPGQIVPAGTDLEEFVVLLLNPLVIPTKTSNALVTGTLPTSVREVGTPIGATLAYTYDPGEIQSKNGAAVIDLTGLELTHVFSGAGIDPSTGVISSNMLVGANDWDISVDYAEGVGDYYDSKGVSSCIFNAATHGCPGDGSRAADTIAKTSNTLTGIYPFLYGADATDLSTGGSALYSAMAKSVTTKSNKTFSIQASSEYIYFAYPKSYGLLTTILDGNGFNVTGSFEQLEANVTSVIVGGTNYTELYYIYKTYSKTSVNPAQDYEFKF